MCQNEGAGLYPYPHSIHPFFPPDPGGCRGYADVAQSVEHRARRYALVQTQPSAPDVCYRIAAPWKGKTATRGLPVRCMKAAGRIIIILLAPAMNGETDATDIPAQG